LFAILTVEILLPHRVEFGCISHWLSQRVVSPDQRRVCGELMVAVETSFH
jgi:hypothetical protein